MMTPVRWMNDKGEIFNSPRARIYGLIGTGHGSDEVLWSGSELSDAAVEWNRLVDSGQKWVSLTGLGCGILARHDEMQHRYGRPRGTFRCPICGVDTPHTHPADVVEDYQQEIPADSSWRDKKWVEIDRRIALLEAKYPQRTPLYTAAPIDLQAVREVIAWHMRESQRVVDRGTPWCSDEHKEQADKLARAIGDTP